MIMVAEAGEDATRHTAERLERLLEGLGIALRLHGEEVSGEKDQIGRLRDGPRSDSPKARDGHEWADVGVGDLDDSKWPLFARVSARVWHDLEGSPRGAGRRGAPGGLRSPACVDDEIELLFAGRERLQKSDGAESVGEPRGPGMKAEGLSERPRQSEQGAGHEERRRPAHEPAVGERSHSRARERDEVHVHGDVQRREGGHYGVEERRHRERQQGVEADEHASHRGEGATAKDRRGDHDPEPPAKREKVEPGHPVLGWMLAEAPRFRKRERGPSAGCCLVRERPSAIRSGALRCWSVENFPEGAERAIDRARAEPLSYAVRILRAPDGRLVAVLGEAHMKLAKAAEIGKDVVTHFELRGVETFQRKKVVAGRALGVAISAPRALLRALSFGAIKGSTILEAKQLPSGHTVELERAKHVPLGLHVTSVYMTAFFFVTFLALLAPLLVVIAPGLAAAVTFAALALQVHMLALVPGILLRRYSWSWLIHPFLGILTLRDELMAAGTVQMLEDHPNTEGGGRRHGSRARTRLRSPARRPIRVLVPVSEFAFTQAPAAPPPSPTASTTVRGIRCRFLRRAAQKDTIRDEFRLVPRGCRVRGGASRSPRVLAERTVRRAISSADAERSGDADAGTRR